jgi:hypothetical protein
MKLTAVASNEKRLHGWLIRKLIFLSIIKFTMGLSVENPLADHSFVGKKVRKAISNPAEAF